MARRVLPAHLVGGMSECSLRGRRCINIQIDRIGVGQYLVAGNAKPAK